MMPARSAAEGFLRDSLFFAKEAEKWYRFWHKMRSEMRSSVKKFGVPILIALLLSACRLGSSGTVRPEEVGLSGKHLRLLDGVLENAISRKDFPGAVILIGRKGKVVFRKAYGQCQWIPKRKPMDEAMIFDLASITKPV